MSDIEKEDEDARDKAMARAVALLTEWYDDVQILACRVGEDGATSVTTRGFGNALARRAMAQEYVEQRKSIAQLEFEADWHSGRGYDDGGDEDDGEDWKNGVGVNG